ncbi:hypothetical protein ACJIZ3_025396 [Penstemon smallii]|uniref:RRM domain-containing protein n=1 Tax=Penstemon smallii TaxID=265156 RepID=A0ABD3TX26_9LAMI
MDYGVPDQNVAVYGEEEPQYEGQYEAQQQRNYNSVSSVDDSAGIKHDSSSSAGKLFVGGIAWETSEEAFSRYFRKYGEITDSVIMLDKISGRPRGFGFITFADPEVADKVLQEDHVIDGRAVEVKRTVPREDMNVRGGAPKTKKIFVGGLPLSLYDDDLKEYFSSFGNVVEHQIMMDRDTGRSRGFGFVTFENEDAVEQILSNGRMHEIGGKQVEIKRAEPKRSGFDNSTETRFRRGGSGSRSSGNFASGSEGYGGGYGGKVGRAYGGGYGGGYGGYGNLAGNYAGGAAGFYPGYGGGYGYGYGFGGPMYGGGAYGGGGYGVGAPVGYGGAAGYGLGGRGYSGGGGGYDGDEGFGTGGGGGGYGPSKGYVGGGSGGAGGYGGSKGYGNGGASSGRFHPYRK